MKPWELCVPQAGTWNIYELKWLFQRDDEPNLYYGKMGVSPNIR